MIELTKTQARRFILAKQGLLGGYRFSYRHGLSPFPDDNMISAAASTARSSVAHPAARRTMT